MKQTAKQAAKRERKGAKILPFRSQGTVLGTLTELAGDRTTDTFDVFEVIEQVRLRMDKVREYLDALEEWSASKGERGKHPRRVARGIRKIADEISKAQAKEERS